MTRPLADDVGERSRCSRRSGSGSSTAWDDEKPHAALLDHALRAQALPELAGRYRSLVDDPERGDRWRRRSSTLIVLAATAVALAMKTPEARKDARCRSR